MFAGRYKILGPLASGGMGQVFRAEHLGLGKEVALKILGRSAAARAESFAERFAREARAIARLDHPGCIRVLDHGEDEHGERYIAMELLDGPTLAEALRGGRFSERRTLHVGRGILAALAHAHAHGVVHRDVKPENVMFALRSGFRVVLIDFGLASLRDAPALTGEGIAMGSPSYIAPERLLGRPHDPRGDLYAVGVIMYEMLAGVRPFEGASREEIMRRALHRPARPLRARRRDVSPMLDAVIRRALAKDPARRFQDAEAMLSALADVSARNALDDARTAEPEGGVDDGQERLESTASMTIALLALERRSLIARAWSWLRYGAWRWRTG